LKTTGAGVVTNGTALAVAVTLGKTLAAVDGAAETTLAIGTYIATADSCFGASAAVTAAGCTVEAAEAKVGSRSACLPAGCREAANGRYCFYSQAKNQVFRPAGATRCTDSGQTLQYRRATESAWLCKISRLSVQRGGNAAPK